MDGQLIAGPFGHRLRRLYEEEADEEREDWTDPDASVCARLLKGKHANEVNAIARCYIVQFDDVYDPPSDEFLSNKDVLVDRVMLRHEPDRRLRRVLQDFPGTKDLWLLVHDDCAIDGDMYEIALSRIDTAEKAIEWTIHMSEKVQWNPHGWIYVLNKLFDRRAV